MVIQENATKPIMRGIGSLLSGFRSAKVTAIIITLLVMLYFLGLLIPQKVLFDSPASYSKWLDQNLLHRVLDAVGFTDIYLSRVTLVLLTLFFLNLIVVIVERLPVVLQRSYLRDVQGAFHAVELRIKPGVRSLSLDAPPEKIFSDVKNFFRSYRWYVLEDSVSTSILAVKNRFSPLGFLLFHLSFLLCLAGGLAIAYTRFSGNIVLTEGQAFEGDMAQFRVIQRTPKLFKAMPSFGLYLEKVHPVHEGTAITGLEAVVQVSYGGGQQREELKVNEPVRRGPYTVIVHDIGLSPLILIKDVRGQVVDAAFFSLNVLKGREDSFRFESIPQYDFRSRFSSDAGRKEEREQAQALSEGLRNPVFHLIVNKEGRRVFNGALKPGGYAYVEPYTVELQEIRYWADLQVVREYGAFPLIAGFLCAAIGLIMRLVFYQKTVFVAVVPDSERVELFIDGDSEYFPEAFREELAAITANITRRLKGAGA